MSDSASSRAAWRDALYRIIFEADTPLGKAFDIALVVSIVLSVLAVMLDSVAVIHAQWGGTLFYAEWFFTIIFTLEYIARLLSVRGVAPHYYALRDGNASAVPSVLNTKGYAAPAFKVGKGAE